MLPEDVQQFIDGANLAIVSTLMKGGAPQSTMTWVDHDGEHVIVNTPKGSQKDRNLSRDGRVSVCVIDHAEPNRYVQIRGRVVDIIGGDEAWQHINKMSQKYSGTDYPRPQERVKLVIQPTRVSALRPSGGATNWANNRESR
jgi:PPOX class probable F420-dependent enzyme